MLRKIWLIFSAWKCLLHVATVIRSWESVWHKEVGIWADAFGKSHAACGCLAVLLSWPREMLLLCAHSWAVDLTGCCLHTAGRWSQLLFVFLDAWWLWWGPGAWWYGQHTETVHLLWDSSVKPVHPTHHWSKAHGWDGSEGVRGPLLTAAEATTSSSSLLLNQAVCKPLQWKVKEE